MSYGDYVEQLTYLLFLAEMADERLRPPYNQASPIPAQYAWPSPLAKDGGELFDHYHRTPDQIGSVQGMVRLITE